MRQFRLATPANYASVGSHFRVNVYRRFHVYFCGFSVSSTVPRKLYALSPMVKISMQSYLGWLYFSGEIRSPVLFYKLYDLLYKFLMPCWYLFHYYDPP